MPVAKRSKGLDSLLYSWIGLGGLIILDVMILSILGIYDFISLFFTIILIPVVVYFYKEKKAGNRISDVAYKAEQNFVNFFVKVIENTISLPATIKKWQSKKLNYSEQTSTLGIVLILALIAGITRLIPALSNAAPFSRNWYFELSSVKSLSLQQYFGEFPEPKGMHIMVNVFSTLTQVSPELILHILGSLSTFFLALIIYWAVQVFTNNKSTTGAILAVAAYAVFPTLYAPVIKDLEVEANSISFALCFAIPTLIFFIRHMRLGQQNSWFYMMMGVIATGLTNLFILLIVLLPGVLLALLTIPRKALFKNISKALNIIIISYAVVLSPYVLFCVFNEISIIQFFQRELLDTMVFSYFPDLILDIEELSIYYFLIAISLFILKIPQLFKDPSTSRELGFLALFAILSLISSSLINAEYVFFDMDQLNVFYAITIIAFIGVLFSNLFYFIGHNILKNHKYTHVINSTIALVFVVFSVYTQGGINTPASLPKTLPDGFFNAYYKIIDERVPYTYATVGPELDRRLAENRHFFMNYDFFLSNYGAIDSLYQQYLLVPDQSDSVVTIPPSSIFVFMEKPPYNSIQQGILYNSESVMKDLEQWVGYLSTQEGRIVEVYYETNDAIVYELINRRGGSSIKGVLNNIYPDRNLRSGLFND
jgi:hypothetical protein